MTPQQSPTAPPSELRTNREILEILWRQGLSGQALLHKHTTLIDSYLEKKFRACPETSGMALIAIGGYGRRELFPFSDIDILLLHDCAPEDVLSSAAEAILYPLWDAGLDVGHSVRTIEQCLTDAEKDFFFQVALLDAKIIIGNKAIFAKLQKEYNQKFISGLRKQFLDQMILHRTHRLKNFNQHGYLLEPNIKEGRGGLRDIQSLLWTAKVIFGLKDLKAIEDAGILSKEEHQNLEQAWEHLIQIRNRLHYLSGRKNDRLYFEMQEEISKKFNYRSTKGIKAVEHFMREVYAHQRSIAVSTDLFFAHVSETIRPLKQGDSNDNFRTLETDIIAHHNHIRLNNHQRLPQKPEAAMRVFLQAAKTGLPVHHQTRKVFSANLDIFKGIQSSKNMSRAFINILQQKPSSTLETMLECGFLAAYLPEFTHLKSLAQHDIYHIYTVDFHLVQTVAALGKIKDEQHSIFEIITEPHILFLAGLLHDIGKGYGKDHASKGATLSHNTGQRLGLRKEEIDLLAFIIKNHLFLTETALRRDLEDPTLIKRCATLIQTPEKLAMLYLLSIADAMATGPTVWNDWKAALLLELYLKIAIHLEKSDQEEQNISQGIAWIRDQVHELLRNDGCPIDLEQLPSDYLLNFSTEDIAQHITLSQSIETDNFIIQPTDKNGHWSLLLITKDSPGLLTKICGVTALNGLEILAAQIFTWPDGTAVDSIDLCPIYGEEYTIKQWENLRDDLDKALHFRLGLDFRLHESMKKLRGSRPESEPFKVVIENNSSETFTIIEVYTSNHLGVIYQIAKALTEFRINIFRAKIGARSDQAVDVFYVLDNNNQKITDPKFTEEIRQSLLYAASQ